MITRAIQRFARLATRLANPAKSPQGVLRRHPKRLVADPVHRIVYLPIPKNACTFFLREIIAHSEVGDEFRQSQTNPHDFLTRTDRLQLRDPDALTDDRYLRLVIIRDPYERIVSAYLNKFVRNTDYPQALMATERFRQSHGLPAMDDLLTFAEFVESLTQDSPETFDHHWRPQVRMLGPFAPFFNVWATMDEIPRVTELLSERYGQPIACEKTRNQNAYRDYSLANRLFEVRPSELRTLERVPSPESLLAPDLREVIGRLYRDDIELYERVVNGDASRTETS